ncbi:copper-binding protein [Gordonia liuliyuniae]|uniref:Copper-binding protein n=1 Tax=Gordonia liuliyuniae TaxID=2911517 RepID=A0ABS9IVV9_9ACTN|nr:copper-binding protein [Gordonia liuliyuniae]MCF8589617.1 copper-binding protein [Gordonia liuliyuniae]
MSVLNRTTGRLAKAAVVGALGAAIALGSTACGAGKISQTTNQLPAVNGAGGSVALDPDVLDGDELRNGQITVRNAQIVYPVENTDKTFADGGPFDISFLISNDSVTRKVKFVEIIGPDGSSVSLTDPKPQTGGTKADPRVLAPGENLLAGVPANVDTSAAQAADIERFTVTLTNAKAVRAGLTTPLTFKFDVLDLGGKKIGEKSLTITTPVDAGGLKQRADVIADAEGEGGGH